MNERELRGRSRNSLEYVGKLERDGIPGRLEPLGRILDPARESALTAAALLYARRADRASLDGLQEGLIPAVLRTAEQFEAWLGREDGDGS